MMTPSSAARTGKIFSENFPVLANQLIGKCSCSVPRRPDVETITRGQEPELIMDDTRVAVQPQEQASSPLPERQSRCYLTYEELSELTGLSLSTLRRRVKDGSLPCFQSGGPRTRVIFAANVIDLLIQSTPADLEANCETPQPQPKPLGPRPKWQRGPV